MNSRQVDGRYEGRSFVCPQPANVYSEYGSRTAYGRSTSALNTLNEVARVPRPSASVPITVSAKPGRLAEAAQGVADVLHQRIEPREAPDGAAVFERQRHTAECARGFAPRLFGGRPGAPRGVFRHLAVNPHLVGKLRFETCAAEPSAATVSRVSSSGTLVVVGQTIGFCRLSTSPRQTTKGDGLSHFITPP